MNFRFTQHHRHSNAYPHSALSRSTLGLLMLLLVSNAFAGERQQQRVQYLDAIKLLSAGNERSARKKVKSLGNYPLLPYYEYKRLSRKLSSAKPREIRKFMESNKDFAVSERLRSRYLFKLAKRKRWDTFLEFYNPQRSSTRMRCYYLQAMLSKGNKNAAYAPVPDLWVSAKSQPASCDPLFESWKAAGGLSEDMKWQRFKLTLQNNQLGLARYIKTLLKPNAAAQAERFLQVHTKPDFVKNRSRFAQTGGTTNPDGFSKNSANADMVIHGLRRMARTDLQGSIKLLDSYSKDTEFNEQDLIELKKSIAFRLQSAPARNSSSWLLKQAQQHNNPDLSVYAARLALLQQDWQNLGASIDTMSLSLREESRWRYWKARYLEETQSDRIVAADAANIDVEAETDKLGSSSQTPSEQKTELMSTAIYRELSQLRDYYGFLSARRIDQPYRFNDTTSTADAAYLAKVAETPGIRMALELYAIDQRTNARREWLHALKSMSKEEQVAAAKVAHNWGWSSQAVMTTIKAKTWDELVLRFPLSFNEYMRRGVSKAGINLSWAYAIARQESAMRPDVVSHAGARGLMQLMPATARQTIRQQRLGISQPKLLTEKQNSLIGTAHLGELITKYKGNRALASAAYNAGSHRVNSWLKRSSKTLSLDVWVETIPFKETRGYVQNVLMFSSIYQYLMHTPVRFIAEPEWRIKPKP